MPTPMVEIKVQGFRCERCGHEWVPRDTKQEPRVCPKCKSAYWNVPKKNVSKKEPVRRRK